MKLTDVIAVPVSVPVGKEYATNRSSAPGQDGSTHDRVVVRVETNRGVTGYGGHHMAA